MCSHRNFHAYLEFKDYGLKFRIFELAVYMYTAKYLKVVI